MASRSFAAFYPLRRDIGLRVRASTLALALLAALSAATWGCAVYRPRPLEPSRAEAEFDSGSLAAPGFERYLALNRGEQTGTHPTTSWNLASLTLAAFYYSRDLAVAQSALQVSEAGIITAGQRPNPSIGIGSQYALTASAFPPWGLGAAQINIPVETAGKRGLRLAEAEHTVEASRFGFGQKAWEIRRGVRSALLAHLIAQRESAILETETATSTEKTQLLSRRREAGAASWPLVNEALSQWAGLRQLAAQVQGRRAESLTQLANSIGVPTNALQGVHLDWPDLDQSPEWQWITPETIRRTALLNRYDLRQALANYSAAEGAVHLEIAKQYPDINIGGGYSWEVGENLFDLLPVVTLPILNQNQGPIAEAKARRAQAGAQFLALQATIIGQAQSAITGYRSALEQLKEAKMVLQFQNARLKAMRRAVEVGEADSLMLADQELLTLDAQRAQLAASNVAQIALGALEDAVERPLGPQGPENFTLPTPVSSGGA